MSALRNTVYGWFKRHLKPTEAQFRAFFNAIWFKDEAIPVDKVDNLPNLLNEKADTQVVTAELLNKVDKVKDKGLSTNDFTTEEKKKLRNLVNTALNDTLTSTSVEEALTANQGRVLKGFIDAINKILASDDVSLDELQEVVLYIKQNRKTLNALSIPNIAGLQEALNNLTTAITTAETNAKNHAKALDDTIKVGGRNLAKLADINAEYKVETTEKFSLSTWEGLFIKNEKLVLEAGKTYTISFNLELKNKVKPTALEYKSGFALSVANATDNVLMTTDKLKNVGDKETIVKTFVCPPLANKSLVFYSNRYSSGNDIIEVTDLMIEKSTKHSNWRPSLEDAIPSPNYFVNYTETTPDEFVNRLGSFHSFSRYQKFNTRFKILDEFYKGKQIYESKISFSGLRLPHSVEGRLKLTFAARINPNKTGVVNNEVIVRSNAYSEVYANGMAKTTKYVNNLTRQWQVFTYYFEDGWNAYKIYSDGQGRKHISCIFLKSEGLQISDIKLIILNDKPLKDLQIPEAPTVNDFIDITQSMSSVIIYSKHFSSLSGFNKFLPDEEKQGVAQFRTPEYSHFRHVKILNSANKLYFLQKEKKYRVTMRAKVVNPMNNGLKVSINKKVAPYESILQYNLSSNLTSQYKIIDCGVFQMPYDSVSFNVRIYNVFSATDENAGLFIEWIRVEEDDGIVICDKYGIEKYDLLKGGNKLKFGEGIVINQATGVIKPNLNTMVLPQATNHTDAGTKGVAIGGFYINSSTGVLTKRLS